MAPSTQFTVEDSMSDGSMPFPDSIIKPKADGTFTIGVYRKPTHTDLYLQWNNHHNIASKYSVINTLTHRAKTVCSIPQLHKEELHHLEEVLMRCKYPMWAINKALSKQENKRKSTTKSHNPTDPHTIKKCNIVVPYSQGLCESYKFIYNKYEMQAHFREGQTLKNLISPMDKDTITQKSSVIYWFKCDKMECKGEYIGESSRAF